MSEHDEQTTLIEWAKFHHNRYPELDLLYAIPNGTRTTPPIARRMVAEGVRKGIPDLCLPVARGNYHALYIEMKAAGAYARPEQRQWIDALKEQGNFATVAHGWEEAAHIIENYLTTTTS